MTESELFIAEYKLKDVYYDDESSVKCMYDSFWEFSKRFAQIDNYTLFFCVGKNKYTAEEYYEYCKEKLKINKNGMAYFEE